MNEFSYGHSTFAISPGVDAASLRAKPVSNFWLGMLIALAATILSTRIGYAVGRLDARYSPLTMVFAPGIASVREVCMRACRLAVLLLMLGSLRPCARWKPPTCILRGAAGPYQTIGDGKSTGDGARPSRR